MTTATFTGLTDDGLACYDNALGNGINTSESDLVDAMHIELLCHDEDGKPSPVTVRVVADEDYGWAIEVIEAGDLVNSDTADTLEAANQIAVEMAKDFEKDDRRRERDRVRSQRQYRKESLIGTAEEMDGADALAVKMLARLIGAGRGADALAALKGVV